MFEFDLVPGPVVRQLLDDDRAAVIDIVRRTYLAHDAGQSVNPDSCFLRFPETPDSRAIALPAFVGGDAPLVGIKWISSFPANTRSKIPRASAVLILNDYRTGYPIACLEAATISAARTAASAAVAAKALRPDGYEGTGIAVVGAGIIARTVCDYLTEAGCDPALYIVHDVDEESGDALVRHLRETLGRTATFTAERGVALEADTVIFATTAGEPYVRTTFKAGQLVLHLSLRDLAPEVILAAANIVDDIEHCMKANTSPHLAEQLTGGRDFMTGTLAGVLTGAVCVPDDVAVIFSPFGLGVLDVAVGAFVHAGARSNGTAISVADFFAEMHRW